jgi:hypothetical protein
VLLLVSACGGGGSGSESAGGYTPGMSYFGRNQYVEYIASQQDPAPAAGEEYFNGGYNTVEHGCRADGSSICGVQIEHHFAGVRDTSANRAAYAAELARVYESFLSQNFGIQW